MPTMQRRLWDGVVMLSAALPLALPPVDPAPSVPRADDELRELERDLRATYPDRRRRAVKKLAALGGDEAWELVIGALADDEPEVADEAQVGLGALRDAKTIAKLYRRDGLGERDEWVRRRVAEAFGRMEGPIDGVRLAGALAPKDPETSRALLWSLERLALAGRLAGDRSRIARGIEPSIGRARPPAVRAAALAALVAVEPVRARPHLERALADRDAEVRRAALVLLHRLDGAHALAASVGGLHDPAAAVRLQAIENLEAIATRACLRPLVERLDVEERTRVSLRNVRALQRLTGMKYRGDARSWRLYVSGLEPDWRPVEEPPALPEQRSVVAFAGLPIHSDRVAFLVDFSGSLWNERPDGRTKKDLADEMIRAALGGLQPGTEFNVIPYANEPNPFAEALVPAEGRNVARAIEFFEECRDRGKGNFFDAALLALADPAVDTIVVLTDGAPTGGRRWNMDLMVELLCFESRFRGVAFSAVLVDAPRRLHTNWSELARRTGGEFSTLQFDEGEGR